MRAITIVSMSALEVFLLALLIWLWRPKMLSNWLDTVEDHIHAYFYPSNYLQDTHKPSKRYSLHQRVYLHEAGHAILAFYCYQVKCIDTITINSDGSGLMQSRYAVGSVKGKWVDIVISLGGMIAELNNYGRSELSGCKKDLECVFQSIDALVQQGIATAPWNIPLLTLPNHPIFQSATSQQLLLLQYGYSMARHLLQVHQVQYHKLVKALISKQSNRSLIMNGQELEQVLGYRWLISDVLGATSNSLFFLPAVKK